MDDFGRVFFKNNNVYRAIPHESLDKCKILLNEPFFLELMQKGLIPKTHINEDIVLDGYGLILEHETLLNTLQYEWSFSMFKNAALTVLEIQSICNKYGYELKDAHTMNILFRGNQAVYVDIGSFQKSKSSSSWVAYSEFISCFYIPLSLWSNGNFYITRKILESNLYFMRTIPKQNVLDSSIMNLTNIKPFYYNLTILKKQILKSENFSKWLYRSSLLSNKIASKLKRRPTTISSYTLTYSDTSKIAKDIQRMDFPEHNTLWKNYHTKFYDDNKKKLPSSPRFDRIIAIVDEIKSKEKVNSTLDLAGNSGLLSFLLDERLKIPSITLSDYDETALEQAYAIQSERNTNVNIVLLNFMLAPNNEDSAKRLKSDIVLALAITHHLLLTSKFLIASVFERIKLYSNKYVMIEFMPLGLWSDESPEVMPNIPGWYNVDWFKKEFEQHFDLLKQEQLEKNRILFVGQVKKL